MTSNSIILNESTLAYISLDQSSINISSSDKEETKEISSIKIILDEISKNFVEIKQLRKNFILDEYEKLSGTLRNNIRKIRKKYTSQKSEKNQGKIDTTKNIQTSSSNQQQNPSTTDQSHLNSNGQSNINANNYTNTNTNTIANTNTNANTNSNIRNENNFKINKVNNDLFHKLNDTTFIIDDKKYDNIIENPIIIYEIYNLMLEISSYLLCYDDIYINFENKSAYFTLKILLQISTLHFITIINRQDFILMIINKICNILCKYNNLNKKDESIKKILNLNEKEINKIKDQFNYDSGLVEKIQKKLKKEIDKFDLSYKIEKIKEEKILENLSNDLEEELKINFKDNISDELNKLNKEKEIFENIQNNLEENHKLYLKEPIKNELEIFNSLLNKLSKYETPIIKKKFLEIIIRNKEVFKYINENIFFDEIPKIVIKNYNLYPFNKNLSVFIDKYIIAGKIILDQLSIPLEQNYLYISEKLEIFAKEFIDKLFENLVSKPKYEINYFHKILFAYMINSNLSRKEDYFNRISVLIDSDSNLVDIYNTLNNTEDIINLYLNKQNKNENIILFDFKNKDNNIISFLFEKKNEEKEKEANNNRKNKKEENFIKKNKKEVSIFSNLELCSILSKEIFELDSLYIILYIALKYWGIQRKIFKYDYVQRKNEFLILDDTILLYFIYYFLIHKDKIKCFNYINKKKNNKDVYKNIKNTNKEKEDKKEEKKEDKKEGKKFRESEREKFSETTEAETEKLTETEREKFKETEKEKHTETEKEKLIEIEEEKLTETEKGNITIINEENKIINKEIEKRKISSLLKSLGESFIEFFWFIHEIMKLASTEKDIVNISLSSKNYILKTAETKDEENDIVMKLIFSDTIIYEINKKNANILKTETTRALYYLLSKSGEELFVFDNHLPTQKYF